MNASVRRRMPRRQRGVALLVALLVVALATILIAALLDRGELAYARTRNALRGEQAEAYAQGLEAYAAQVLLSPQRQGADTNASPWALPLPPQPVPGGLIGATMRDLNGCFNLNNLAPDAARRDDWRRVFDALLGQLGLDLKIADAVQAWLGAGEQDDTNAYLAQPVPYRPRHGPFAHVSELRLVNGVSAEAYARLAPHVCALPPGTKLNVNTAGVPLLASIGGGAIPPAIAQRLWNGGRANFSDLRSFAQEAGLGRPLDGAMYDVSSRYFLARGDIVLDGVPFAFFSLIEQRQGVVRVLARSRGADDALAAPAPVGAAGEPSG